MSTQASPSSLLSHPLPIFAAAALMRAGMLIYGLWQDANSPVKYTDIDYLVFTDAARFTAHGSGPYARETYRYTPLLAWLLLPTTLPGTFWFSFGKILFSAADLVAGWFLILILRGPLRMSTERAVRYSAIWLLNPMVATISTRGSSEGVLGALTVSLLWAVLEKKTTAAGVLLGVGVHFKIYPFIYAFAIMWWMDAEKFTNNPPPRGVFSPKPAVDAVIRFLHPERVKLVVISFVTFALLNYQMLNHYGFPFIQHTFLHHVSRIDHRHNFSPYNILLYLTSAYPSSSVLRIESLAFLPQLLLSTVLIPIVGAKKDLPATMLAQTFAFVTFNKVCTSQYFLWYMIFLPIYLPNSSLLKKASLGVSALVLWVLSQAAWLQQGYELEFLGNSTFVPGLWTASLGFFAVNCWILGLIVDDFIKPSPPAGVAESKRA